MSADELNAVNLLQDTYSIDDKSFNEDDESCSVGSSSKLLEDVQYINFIQAIKDDNVELLKPLIHSFPSFVNKVGPEGLTGIQYATLFSNQESFKYLIGQQAMIECQVEGLPLLHLSLAFSLFEHHRHKTIEFFRFLYEGNPSLRDHSDRLGRKIIHLIAQYDLDEALKIIDVNINDLIAKDHNGDSPINYIYLYHSYTFFEKLCLLIGVKTVYSKIRNHSIKFVEGCFVFHCFEPIEFLLNNSKEIIDELTEDITNTSAFYSNSEEIVSNCRLSLEYLEQRHYSHDSINIINDNVMNGVNDANSPNNNKDALFQHNKISFQSSENKTTLVYNNNCILHIKLPEDPVKRIKLRHEQIENSDRLCVLLQPPFGILLSDKMVKNPAVYYKESQRKAVLADILRCHDIGYINKIKKQCEDCQETPVLIDSDTYINKNTFESIFDATGCVMDAIDIVMSKESTNSFALLRPPGHHAGYFGALTLENQNVPISNGFCIVNNVCIGAAYCKYQYRNIISKIAIVDFDVHHGNGTEEIVSLLDHKEMHTNFKSFLGNIEVTKTFMNPWLDYDDPSNVLFISLHAYNDVNPKAFYPYSGSADNNTKKLDPIYPGGILNIPLNQSMKYSYEYRNIFRQKVIQRLHKFKPDIIFISAGFDGHEKEEINAGLMCLNELDYSFLTEQIQNVANKYCEGRLVSVLEGGYNVQSGIVSSFAQSVISHAKSLNRSINKAKLQEIPLTQLKRQREYEKDYENFKLSKNMEPKPRRSERIRHNAEEKEKEKDQQIDIQYLNNVFSYENEIKMKNELIKSNDDKIDHVNKQEIPNEKDDLELFEINEEDAKLI